MQVSVENLSGLEKKLTITIPAERVAKETASRLQTIAPKAKIAGFRPGKIPFTIIEKRFGESAREEAIGKIMHETYSEALKEKQLNPASYPKIEIITNKPNEPFSFSATVETYPEIKLYPMSNVEVTRYVAEITEKDLEEALEKIRKEQVTWKEISGPDRNAQNGDQLTIDFTYNVHSTDRPPEPKTEKDVKFVLGSGFMWNEFEAPLYKTKAGDETKFTLKFPLTHTDKSLVGKYADFKVKVKKVCEPIFPELNDDLAKKLGIKEGGLTELKDEVRKNMDRDLQQTLKSLFKAAVLEKLFELNPIEAPKVLIERELQSMRERWEQSNAQVSTEKKSEFPRASYQDRAERFVKMGLLLATIIKEYNIKVNPEELKAKIEEMAAPFDDSAKVINWYYGDKERLLEVESTLLEEKAINQIGSQFKIIDKPISYKELISKRGGR